MKILLPVAQTYMIRSDNIGKFAHKRHTMSKHLLAHSNTLTVLS